MHLKPVKNLKAARKNTIIYGKFLHLNIGNHLRRVSTWLATSKISYSNDCIFNQPICFGSIWCRIFCKISRRSNMLFGALNAKA